MAGQQIVTSDTQLYNAYTQSKQIFHLHMTLGAGGSGSTPTIVYADADTQRFAVSMPSVGTMREIRVLYESKTGGSAVGTFDFRLYDTPWGASRKELYDKIYEKKNIAFQELWQHKIADGGLDFANRVGYNDVNPANNQEVALPRNFLWMELKPNDATVVAPIVLVKFVFEV